MLESVPAAHWPWSRRSTACLLEEGSRWLARFCWAGMGRRIAGPCMGAHSGQQRMLAFCPLAAAAVNRLIDRSEGSINQAAAEAGIAALSCPAASSNVSNQTPAPHHPTQCLLLPFTDEPSVAVHEATPAASSASSPSPAATTPCGRRCAGRWWAGGWWLPRRGMGGRLSLSLSLSLTYLKN
jgi:hypothetical protein